MGNAFSCVSDRNGLTEVSFDEFTQSKSKSQDGQGKVLTDVFAHHQISPSKVQLTDDDKKMIADIDNLIYLLENNIIFDPKNIPGANYKSLFRLLILYNKFDHKMSTIEKDERMVKAHEIAQQQKQQQQQKNSSNNKNNPKSPSSATSSSRTSTRKFGSNKLNVERANSDSIDPQSGDDGDDGGDGGDNDEKKSGNGNAGGDEDGDYDPDDPNSAQRRRTEDVIDSSLNEFNRGSHWERSRSIAANHPFAILIDKILNYVIFNLNTDVESHKYIKQMLAIEWIVQAFNSKQFKQLVNNSKKHLILFNKELKIVHLEQLIPDPKFSLHCNLKRYVN